MFSTLHLYGCMSVPSCPLFTGFTIIFPSFTSTKYFLLVLSAPPFFGHRLPKGTTLYVLTTSTSFHHITLRSVMLHYVTLHCIMLHYITSRYIMSRYVPPLLPLSPSVPRDGRMCRWWGHGASASSGVDAQKDRNIQQTDPRSLILRCCSSHITDAMQYQLLTTKPNNQNYKLSQAASLNATTIKRVAVWEIHFKVSAN